MLTDTRVTKPILNKQADHAKHHKASKVKTKRRNQSSCCMGFILNIATTNCGFDKAA